MLDEQRLVGSGTWVKAFLKIAKNNRWILLSATPGDTWCDFIPVFVANGFYKNITDFKRQHVVYSAFSKFPKIERFIDVGRLARHRASVFIEMSIVRHTRRRHVEVDLSYDKETLDRVLKERWHVFEDRPLRDAGELCSVSRRVVNSDPSRLEMVRELWKIHPKLIIFYNYNFELEILRGLKTVHPWTDESLNPDLSRLSGVDLRRGTTSSWLSSDGSNRKISTTESSKNSSCGSALERGMDNRVTESTRGEHPEKPSRNTYLAKTSKTGSPAGSEKGLHHPSSSTMKSRSSLVDTPTHTDDPTGSKTSHSIAIAEWNGHKHEEIPKTDRWLYLVQYTAGAEGWNCVETDAMIFYSQNYSYKVYEQAQGRIDRLNTPFDELWYYNFTSDSWIDRAIGRSLRGKKTFNEGKFKGLFGPETSKNLDE